MAQKKIQKASKKGSRTELTQDSLDGFDYELTKSGEELAEYIKDISDTVRTTLDQSVSLLTPWFFKNMPNIYYQATPRAEKVKHLRSIMTGNIFESKQIVEIWDENKEKVTFIGPGERKDILFYIARKVKNIHPNLGSFYFSRDKLLFLASFFCKDDSEVHHTEEEENVYKKEKIEQTRKLLEAKPELKEKGNFEHFLKHLDNNMVKYATPERILLTYEMLSHMLHSEGAYTILSETSRSGEFRISLGVKGLKLEEILDQVIIVIERYGFNIVRYFVKEFSEGYSHTINVFHFVLETLHLEEEKEQIEKEKLVKALKTLAWIDSDEYNAFSMAEYGLSPNATNFLRSLANWVHILLGKENAYYYSEYKIFQTFLIHNTITQEILALFRLKFDPKRVADRANESYKKKREFFLGTVTKLIDSVERNIFLECLNFVDHVLKTNYFIPTKTGLAFRLDPKLLDSKHYNQIPFSIFFIVGKNYRFIHVRWRDVARGGLRIILPRTATAYAYANSGLFDEVYGLSFAQQLKNKDIPEGGSKGVLLVKPKADHERALKGAVNALLDLLVLRDEEQKDLSSKIVSYYKPEEIIYLGPDENMTNNLICWTQEQAEKRGYKYHRAFMSSKPEDGINHKEYGVTSEGLNVYVEHVLKRLKINPEVDSFSVKMTGGPDGDVAGNELKILYRKYEKTCKLVAIADGFGAASDPEGLNWDELMRLVKEGKSIVCFDKKMLSGKEGCFVIGVETVEEIEKRNKIHSTITADLLIPAGGRPYTVREENVDEFFLEDGRPSCQAVVEGANIFFTDKAREILQARGVLMIKDSSANKTGVICSSFEIIASLVLEKNEFKEVKKQYVEEVLTILRQRAHQEALLLFHEKDFSREEISLTELSKKISSEINSLKDLLLGELIGERKIHLKDEFLNTIILRHCPPILREKYANRVIERLPEMYKVAIVASYCASYITYNEGLNWVSSFPKNEQFKAIITYMKNDVVACELGKSIEIENIKDKEKILAILKKSGASALTSLAFEVL